MERDVGELKLQAPFRHHRQDLLYIFVTLPKNIIAMKSYAGNF